MSCEIINSTSLDYERFVAWPYRDVIRKRQDALF